MTKVTTSLLVPLSNEGLLTLQRAEDYVSTEVTNGYFAMHPECYKGDPDRIRKMCKDDLQHHFHFLISAMVSAIPEVFRDYSFWLKEVLLSRNLSLQHAVDSFGLMKTSMVQRLSEADKAVATAVLDAGLEVFGDDSIFVQSYSVDPEALMASAPLYTKALVAGDRKASEAVFDERLKQGYSLADVSVGVVQAAMYDIGRLWQENKITVAQEHLATAISQNMLARGFSNTEFSHPVDKRIVSACIEGNHHSLGLRMISDTYEVAGWDATFLGADTPNTSILQQVDMEKPDVLAISVSLPTQVVALQQLMKQLRAEMGAQMPAVVVGGLAINRYKNLGSQLKIDAYYQDAKAVQADIK